MLPGVIQEKLGDFVEGDVRCVMADGNACPIAIGVMEVNSADITELKGKALRVIHYFGDLIWELGGSSVPNPGFKPGEVEPVGHPSVRTCFRKARGGKVD